MILSKSRREFLGDGCSNNLSVKRQFVSFRATFTICSVAICNKVVMICDKRAVAVISNNYLPLQQTNVWFWNHSQTSVHASPKPGGICPHDFEKPTILRSPENNKTIQMMEGLPRFFPTQITSVLHVTCS